MKLIKLNENTYEFTVEDFECDTEDIFYDGEIFYGMDNISIVCISHLKSTIEEYKKILLKRALNEAREEVNYAYKEMYKLNQKAFKLSDLYDKLYKNNKKED